MELCNYVLILYLFLNYYLFDCGLAKQSNLESQQRNKHNHNIDKIIREIREKLRKAQSERKAFNPGPNLEDGLLDYDITHIDFLGRTKVEPADQFKNTQHKEGTVTTGGTEGFLNYDITHMFWSATPKTDKTLINTPPQFYLPSPVGHGVTEEDITTSQSTTTPNPWLQFDNIAKPATIPGLSDPFDPLDYSEHPVVVFSTTTLATHSFPDYYETISVVTRFSRPSFPFSVPPQTTPSIITYYKRRTTFDSTYVPGSPSKWIGPLTTLFPGLTNLHGVPTDPTTTESTTTTSSTRSTTSSVSTSPRPPIPIPRNRNTAEPSWRPLSNFVSKSNSEKKQTWMKITPEKNKSLMDLLNVKVTRITQKIYQRPVLGRTLSKGWAHIRHWATVSEDEKTRISHFWSIRPWSFRTASLLPTTKPTGPPKWLSTHHVNTEQFFTYDDHGFMHVTIPTSVPEMTVFIENITTNAGAVLHEAHTLTIPPSPDPIKPYHDMMLQQNEGYLVVFLLEFSRLLVMKNEQHVRDVVLHAEFIINGYYDTGSISWMGITLAEKAIWLGMFFSEAERNKDNFKTAVALVHRMLRDRGVDVSADVNSALDLASSFYDNEEGEELFNTLQEFEKYPNVTQSGRELCVELIDAFMAPFRRLRTAPRCRHLITSIENILAERFGPKMSVQVRLKKVIDEGKLINS